MLGMALKYMEPVRAEPFGTGGVIEVRHGLIESEQDVP